MDKGESLFVQLIKVLTIGLIAAIILYFTIWGKYIYAIHTLLEVLCIFIGASVFLIVWNTIDKMSNVNYIIGFGFLAVVIFNSCHTYLFAVQLSANYISLDLTIKYWFLGRLTEAIVLYLASLKTSIVKLNKWIYLVFTIIIPIGIVFVIYKFPGAFPTMSTTAGPTLAKKLGESIIILIIFLSLMNLRRNINTEDTVSYMHLFMVPLILIFTEAMFFKRSSVYSFSVIYGHVLRILCYYYLYKSIYVSSIEYSYEKMKLENIKLEEAYRQLEESKKDEIRRQGMLMQQEKLALLGQMGAGIVHETRNYLTTIKGSYQLAKLFAKEECVIKHLERINKNTDEINRIMNGFLLMSKPRETELLEVSMYDLLESVKSLIISTSLVKKVDVFFDITKEERYLLCDEGQINQVILNLCKNAVEAMEDKEDSKLFIETGYDAIANEMCIHVKDNGKGITEKDLKKIGTPFYTTKNAGTGLGLYMCHQIIKEHNGRMDVCSELGKGTCFTVTLPCLSDEEREEESGTYPNYI